MSLRFINNDATRLNLLSFLLVIYSNPVAVVHVSEILLFV